MPVCFEYDCQHAVEALRREQMLVRKESHPTWWGCCSCLLVRSGGLPGGCAPEI